MRFKSLLDICVGDHTHPNYVPWYGLADYVAGVDIRGDALGAKDVDHFDVLDCENQLPYNDGEFEVVFSDNTIEHIRNAEQFYKELQRVASKRVIVRTPHRTIDNLNRAFNTQARHRHDHPHVSSFDATWFKTRTELKWIFHCSFTAAQPVIQGRIVLPFQVAGEIILELRRK